MVFFRASIPFNDSYAFRHSPKLTAWQRMHQQLAADVSGPSHCGVQRCRFCGELLAKWDEPLTGLIIKNVRYDISITYDGIVVASERFLSAYHKGGLSGLAFRPLPDHTSFFAIWATRTVPFDAERRGTRFLDPCSECGRYESVVGATPVYLRAGCQVGDLEIVRTDLEFGSGDEKHPLLLCAQGAARVLSQAKLKGLVLVADGGPRSVAP